MAHALHLLATEDQLMTHPKFHCAIAFVALTLLSTASPNALALGGKGSQGRKARPTNTNAGSNKTFHLRAFVDRAGDTRLIMIKRTRRGAHQQLNVLGEVRQGELTNNTEHTPQLFKLGRKAKTQIQRALTKQGLEAAVLGGNGVSAEMLATTAKQAKQADIALGGLWGNGETPAWLGINLLPAVSSKSRRRPASDLLSPIRPFDGNGSTAAAAWPTQALQAATAALHESSMHLWRLLKEKHDAQPVKATGGSRHREQLRLFESNATTHVVGTAANSAAHKPVKIKALPQSSADGHTLYYLIHE